MMSSREIYLLMRLIEASYSGHFSIIDGYINTLFSSNFPTIDTKHMFDICMSSTAQGRHSPCIPFESTLVKKHQDLVSGAFYKLCPFGVLELVGTIYLPPKSSFQLFFGAFQPRNDLPATALIHRNRQYSPLTERLPKLSDHAFQTLPALMDMLTREIGELFHAQLLEDATEYDDRQLIENFINGHFRQPITLTDLATVLHCSPSHATVKVRKHFGQTFIQLLNTRRIANAKWLLQKKSHYTVAHVAFVSGFTNPLYFYRVFQKITGMTPACFRQQQLKERL